MKKAKAMVLSMVKLREAQLTAKIASAFSLIIQIILLALTEIPFSEEEYEDSILFFLNRSSTHTSSFDRNTIFEEEEESSKCPVIFKKCPKLAPISQD